MDTDYQYILDKSSKKHICPKCGKKSFVRYIDITTDNYLPKQYGRCDRKSKCAYFFNPYTDGYNMQNPTNTRTRSYKVQQRTQPPITSFIPIEVLKKALSGYEQNTFIQNLLNRVEYTFEIGDYSNLNPCKT
jgi:hypothetical protein